MIASVSIVDRRVGPYSRHLEVSEDTACSPSHDASVANLRSAGVAVHLRELELGLGAHPRRQGCVSDHVAKSLPERSDRSAKRNVVWKGPWDRGLSSKVGEGTGSLPLGLVLLEHHALGVVSYRSGLDKAAQIELLRPEHGHGGREWT